MKESNFIDIRDLFSKHKIPIHNNGKIKKGFGENFKVSNGKIKEASLTKNDKFVKEDGNLLSGKVFRDPAIIPIENSQNLEVSNK